MKNKKGGKPIDSGTYGCVFNPALACKGSKRPTGVSKLMIDKHASKELNLLEPIYTLTKQYPDIKSYIIIPELKQCTPSKLTTEDLYTFNDTCHNLYDLGYNTENINRRRDEFKLLHMEHGGKTVGDYIQDMHADQEYHIHKGIADIFKHVIVPMNQNNLYHSDIKENNILVKKNKLKLIDFGLMILYTDTTIDPMFLNHYLSMHYPYTCLLFNDDIPFHWSSFYRKHNHLKEEMFIQACSKHIMDSILRYKKSQGLSNKLLSKESSFIFYCNILFPHKNYLEIIARQLAYCYHRYKNPSNGEFDILSYYNKEFIHTVDIWGLCTVLLYLFTHYNSSYHDKLEKLKPLLIKYMFSMHVNPFPYSEFYKDLMSHAHYIKSKSSKSRSSKSRSSKSRSSKSRSSKSRSSNKKHTYSRNQSKTQRYKK
jgi:hypothetical protein